MHNASIRTIDDVGRSYEKGGIDKAEAAPP